MCVCYPEYLVMPPKLPGTSVVYRKRCARPLVIDMDGMAIVFVEKADVIRAHPLLEPRFRMFPRGIGVTLHFEVTEIEDIRDAIMEEGLEVLYPLEIKPCGVKKCGALTLTAT